MPFSDTLLVIYLNILRYPDHEDHSQSSVYPVHGLYGQTDNHKTFIRLPAPFGGGGIEINETQNKIVLATKPIQNVKHKPPTQVYSMMMLMDDGHISLNLAIVLLLVPLMTASVHKPFLNNRI